jgi:hypothetical protein
VLRRLLVARPRSRRALLLLLGAAAAPARVMVR